MQKNIYDGKTYDEVKEKALSELKVAEENLIINITSKVIIAGINKTTTISVMEKGLVAKYCLAQLIRTFSLYFKGETPRCFLN